jgi:hypothetical protein
MINSHLLCRWAKSDLYYSIIYTKINWTGESLLSLLTFLTSPKIQWSSHHVYIFYYASLHCYRFRDQLKGDTLTSCKLPRLNLMLRSLFKSYLSPKKSPVSTEAKWSFFAFLQILTRRTVHASYARDLPSSPFSLNTSGDQTHDRKLVYLPDL